jgi:hypothetical protein
MSSVERRIARLERLLEAPPVGQDEFDQLIAQATLRTRARFVESTDPDNSPEALRAEGSIAAFIVTLGIRD